MSITVATQYLKEPSDKDDRSQERKTSKHSNVHIRTQSTITIGDMAGRVVGGYDTDEVIRDPPPAITGCNAGDDTQISF